MIEKIDTSILDCIPAAAYIRDGNKNILYVNAAAEDISGVNRKEALGQKCWQIFGDAARSCYYDCEVDSACKQGRSLGCHRRAVVFANGSTVSILVSTTPLIIDGESQAVLVMLENGSGCNVSEQSGKNRQQESENGGEARAGLERQLQDFADDPVFFYRWNTGPGWPVEYVSRNIGRYGYPSGHFRSGELQFGSFIHLEDMQGVIQGVEQNIALGKASFTQEYRLITADGDVRWVSDFSRIIRCGQNDVNYIDSCLFDITQYRQEREESHRNRDMLAKLLDALPQAVFWKDLQGRFLGCNQVFANAFGFRGEDEVIGKTDRDFPISQDIQDAYRADDCEVIATRRPKYNIVEPIHLKDGKQRWGNTSKAPLFDDLGEPFGILGIFDDITDRMAMEEALEKRIIALTMPLDDPEQIEFGDLFCIEELQQLQDRFCKATGVGGLIVRPDGTALSQPSNSCTLCSDAIRGNSIGKDRCVASDVSLGHTTKDGPIVRKCKSAGLWSGGAAIRIGGRHLASWLIGQVRDENQSEEQIRRFAREIGADEETLVRSFLEVPVMSCKQFGHVAEALYTLTQYLSTLAYQNVQQARYITQRKRAEVELINSREEVEDSRLKLQMALSMAKMGHWEGSMSPLPNMGESIFTFNDQFYELYGTTAGREGGYEMTAQRYTEEFVHPDDAWMMSLEVDTLLGKLGADDSRQLEHRIVRRDGEVRHIAVCYRLQRDQMGEPRKTLGVNQDITERKLAEKLLLKAKHDAEAANRAKSVFLANMSHEIRTPLNGLMGMLQLLQGSNTQPEHEEYIDIAIRSSKRLTRLLADILDISKVEAGKMQLSSEPFVIRDTLESLVQLFQPTAMAKGLTLSIKIDARIPEKLVGDGFRLQQVLGNLVGNAVKFTLNGGVHINVHPLPISREKQCRLLFCVVDTGIGISDETLAKLFIPFSQDQERFRHQFDGVGLGLAIARQLTELMGGTIAAVSEEGNGASFYLSLPFDLVETDCQETTCQPLPNFLPNCSVLLVEDDAISRMVAEQLMIRSGFAVRTAENGQEALDLLRKEKFSLVIMDVQMPVLDGLQTTRAIREGGAGEENRTIPIIAMTARAMDEDKQLMSRAGMNGYVEKPMELERLLEEMHNLCKPVGG